MLVGTAGGALYKINSDFAIHDNVPVVLQKSLPVVEFTNPTKVAEVSLLSHLMSLIYYYYR